jgi:hypothetical protein
VRKRDDTIWPPSYMWCRYTPPSPGAASNSTASMGAWPEKNRFAWTRYLSVTRPEGPPPMTATRRVGGILRGKRGYQRGRRPGEMCVEGRGGKKRCMEYDISPNKTRRDSGLVV